MHRGPLYGAGPFFFLEIPMRANPTSMVRWFSGLALAASLASLPGCGQGSYTREHVSQAQAKLDTMKSATEHDMARQAYFAGNFREALERVDRSIAINDQVARSYVLRGRILIETGELDESLVSLKQGAELDAENVEAQYYLGVVYERLGELDDALSHYRRAAELDPSDAQYAVAAAEVMIDQDSADEAETYLLSFPTYEHNAGVRQTLGHIATMRGDHARAATMLGEARLLAPDDEDILEDLARAQVSTGNFREAETNLSRLLKTPERRASRRDLVHMHARCLAQLKRYTEARDSYLSLVESDEGAGDVDAWIGLGNVACILKDPLRHRAAATRIMALAPDREEGYLLRALWHQRRGEPEEAIKWLDEASRHVARPVSALTMKGVILKELGRADEAREALAAALRANPQDRTLAALVESLDSAD